MATIFLDESGYTGQDLLNEDQPIFTLASLRLSESDCQEFKRTFFSNVESIELKYSSLSKRHRQQKMIVLFLKELARKPGLVKVFYAHKQFVLVTKMVEILVEPVYYHNGKDIYDKGANIALSNLLFYTLPVFEGVNFFKNLLINFQAMIRFKTEAAYQAFFEPILTQEYAKEIDGVLEVFRMSHAMFGYEQLVLNTQEHLDIAVSSTLSLMSLWRQDIDDDIILIHDRSSAMARDKKIWDEMVDPNLPSIEVGYDRRKAQFPIRVTKTCSEDSKNWAGLQLVDIIAGTFTRCAKWFSEGRNAEDSFGESLAEILGEAFDCFPIFPQKKFTPDQLGTTGDNAFSPHDYFVSIFMQNQSVIRATGKT